MRMTKHFAAVAGAVFACSLVLASVSLADAPSRPATPAEKAFHDRVLSVLKNSIPDGPPDWDVTRRSSAKSIRHVSQGLEIAPMVVDYSMEWADTEAKRAAEEAMLEASHAAMNQDMAANPTDDGQARFEKLAEQLGEAMNQGDMAEVARLQKRMETVGQELSRAYDQRNTAVETAAREHEVKDVSMSVVLRVNSLHHDLHGYTEAGSFSGMPMYRSRGEHSAHYGWQEGNTVVFAGKGWRLARDGDSVWMSTEARDMPHTEAQTLVVRIQAEEGRARGMLERLDWAALRGLLK
ncbi:MAG: hypothetical protein ACLFOY_07830 [Desulfatibacillaceae bacterium]